MRNYRIIRSVEECHGTVLCAISGRSNFTVIIASAKHCSTKFMPEFGNTSQRQRSMQDVHVVGDLYRQWIPDHDYRCCLKLGGQ